MKNPGVKEWAMVLLLASCGHSAKDQTESTMPAPVAKKIPVVLENHGVKRIDPYYWLRERENPEVIAYLEAENAYAESGMSDVAALKDTLFEEMKARLAPSDESVPYTLNGYSYYTRYEEGQEYPLYCRRKVADTTEQVMINANELAAGHTFYDVGSTEVSPDNAVLCFGEDTVGRRLYALRFKNLSDGSYYPDVISGTTGPAVFAADSRTVFYTVQDPHTLRAYRIFRHVLGTPQAQDELVYEEQDETYRCYVYPSKSQQYVLIASASTTTSEYRLLPADQPMGEFRVFQPRTEGMEYSIDHLGDHFYIRTNADGAVNFKLCKAPVSATAKEHWREVIPHRSDVLLENFELFSRYLVVQERDQGLTRIQVKPWDAAGEAYELAFDDPTYSAYIGQNPELDTDTLRYGYMSMTTPSTVYDFHMKTREQKLMKRQQVLGDFDPSQYQSQRLMATANDGTQIPISIVYRKGFERKGNSPLLLYGYGSYGHSLDPWFSSANLSLLNRGFAFAIAHVRGGEDMGRQWYLDGKLMRKVNTFTDFIACAEHLIAEKYTSPEHLYAMGGSAGGLLMGAVANMRPELWQAIVAQVPFVDVVTTMLDSTIPLTTNEYDEWGNPNEAEAFEYMLSYSPYDNVEAQDYPAMLVTTGLHDSQVQYWEPAKWVAKLRDLSTGSEPIYLVTNMEAGHGGASGRFKSLEDKALEFSFLLQQEATSGAAAR